MFTKKNIIFIALIIIVGGGSFFGGMKVGESNKSNMGARNFQNMTDAQKQQFAQQNPNRVGQNGMGETVGEIISKDDKSITVKLTNGGSKIILYAVSTEISKFASGTASDIEIGKTVMVSGITNTDGSMTAKSIQIRSAENPTQ